MNRKWKRMLAVLLAAAMVLSMNATALYAGEPLPFDSESAESFESGPEDFSDGQALDPGTGDFAGQFQEAEIPGEPAKEPGKTEEIPAPEETGKQEDPMPENDEEPAGMSEDDSEVTVFGEESSESPAEEQEKEPSEDIPEKTDEAIEIFEPAGDEDVTVAVSSAVWQVQFMIDALPALEDLKGIGKDGEALEQVNTAVNEALCAYEALASEEKLQVKTAKMDELLAFFQERSQLIGAPKEDEDEEEKKPELFIRIYSGEKGKEKIFDAPQGAVSLTSYSDFYIRAYLKYKNEETEVTKNCRWTSAAPSCVSVLDGADMLKTGYPNSRGSITLTAEYTGDNDETFSCSISVIVENLKIESNREVMEYFALSYLAYTDFSKDQEGKTIGELLRRGDKLQDSDQYINNKGKFGVKFAGLYSAAVSNWIYVERHNEWGLDASVFRNPVDNRYVIAYRGTENPVDWIEDIYIGEGWSNSFSQIRGCIKFYEDMIKKYGIRKDHIIVTGHSLGGGLANCVSILQGVKAYTFNAPSTLVSTIQTFTQEFTGSFTGLDGIECTDYVNNKDEIGNTGVGDNSGSNKYLNLTLGRSSQGGLIDRTQFVKDQSTRNGEDNLAPYHGFRQMLFYNMAEGYLSIEEVSKTAPESFTFNLRGRTYALGSTKDDLLTYRNGDAYVFGGGGDDTIAYINDISLGNVLHNDKICGGIGNDTIKGTHSDQDYLYTKGDGYDTIYDFGGKDAIYIYGYDDPASIESEESADGRSYHIKADGKPIMKLSREGSGKYTVYVGNKKWDLERTGKTVSIEIACPVDMKVYDPLGNPVCELKDGQPMNESTDYGYFTVEKQGEEYVKTAILYNDAYSVKLFGTGEGTMRYRCTVTGSDEIESRLVVNVPVKKGAVYTAFNDFSQGILEGDLDGDGETDYEAFYEAPQAVVLDTQEKELGYFDTLSLEAAVLPENAVQEVKWASSDMKVAIVDETGTVTATGPGSAEITAACAENEQIQAVCRITVPEKPVLLAETEASVDEKNLEYTGSSIEPEVTVTYQGVELTEGIHYSLEYENNVFPGTASAVLTGIGLFTGSLTLNFEILPVPDETVEKKVEKLVAECRKSGAEQEDEIALWFHDWLIYHADYDYSYTEYYADGVLLKGLGVCQSYALAYQALLDAAGIENMVISAPEMDHAWNIVKINGSWTHIDCTWDDPNYGGYENHSYFGLSDAEMEEDHQWDHSQYPEGFSIKWSDSHYLLPEPYELNEPVEGIDFTLLDTSGQVLTREDFKTGNMLLIFGRPTCSNTMGFINEIISYKEILEVNDLNVIVVFENKEQVLESAGQIPFICTYEADMGYEAFCFTDRQGIGQNYQYPLIILQNPEGQCFYYSIGHVYNPQRVVSTAIQELPETEAIESVPLNLYSNDSELKAIIQKVMSGHASILKIGEKNRKIMTKEEMDRIADMVVECGSQYQCGWTKYEYFGNVGIFTLGYTGIPEHTHQWVTDPAVEATCTQTGLTEGSHCSICGEVRKAQQETPKIPHTFPAERQDCTKPVTCMVCGFESVPGESQHNFAGSDWYQSEDGESHYQVCQNEGCKVSSNPEAHSGGEATCKERAVCRVCGQSYGEKKPDRHDGGTELRGYKAATEKEEGYTGDTYCLGCGVLLEKGMVIPKLTSGMTTPTPGGLMPDPTITTPPATVPAVSPTVTPTPVPTASPSVPPTNPTTSPTVTPTPVPTVSPSVPLATPTAAPTVAPTAAPAVTETPAATPTAAPEESVTPTPELSPAPAPEISPVPAPVPVEFTVTAQDYRSVKIAWIRQEDADGYRVWRKAGKEKWKKIATLGSSADYFIDKNAELGTQYVYTVRAYRKTEDEILWTPFDSAGQKGSSALAAPTVKTKAQDYHTVSVIWNRVAGADGYCVYKKEPGGTWKRMKTIPAPEILSYEDTGASVEKPSLYTVRAYSIVNGTTVFGSFDEDGKEGIIPIGTVKLRSVNAVSYNKVKITWARDVGAQYYRVYRKTAGEKSWTKLRTVGTATRTYTDSTAVPGIRYYYTVRAYTMVNGKGIWSDYNKKGIAVTTKVDTVKLAGASSQDGKSIRVTWNKVTGASGYRVYRKTSGGSWKKLKEVSAQSLAYTDTSAKSGVTYFYTVRAFYKSGSYKTWGGYDRKGVSAKIK